MTCVMGQALAMAELGDLQRDIAAERARRGFTTDPVQLVVLLSEELGEIAREVKKTWSPNYGDHDTGKLAAELADTLVLLSALASTFGLDLEAAVHAKFFGADGERSWPSAT